MPYLYTPPQREEIRRVKGSLSYREIVSLTVYRSGGVWLADTEPFLEEGEVDSDDDGTLLFFTSPRVVPSSLQPELSAFGEGTLTLL